MKIVYLHGFASSPASKKARFFAERIPGLIVPELSEGDFFGLTITKQLDVVRRLVDDGDAALIGSSLGGYLAALYAARHPRHITRTVLLAPAFRFAGHWAERLGSATMASWEATGSLTTFHYGAQTRLELGWGLMEDARRYEPQPDVTQPCLILHGVNDDVVPVQFSQAFAQSRPNVRLVELNSDHELLNVTAELWAETRTFLDL